jgi:hypothetical protein
MHAQGTHFFSFGIVARRTHVNARASEITQLGMDTSASARAEHISLEAEADVTAPPARPPHRKVRSTFVLKSSLRKCSTELSLLDDHYLQVNTIRARRESKKYSLDLRFLNSQPVRVRRIAWTWFALGAASSVVGAVGLWFAWSKAALMFSSPAFIGACVALIATAIAVVDGVRTTTESLNFTSVHGGASFVSVTGGLGSTKSGKAFFVAMIKEITAAKAARPQGKQQWLRDEMREHHRLRELGVLKEADYEASKARILKAHA